MRRVPPKKCAQIDTHYGTIRIECSGCVVVRFFRAFKESKASCRLGCRVEGRIMTELESFFDVLYYFLADLADLLLYFVWNLP